MIKVEGSLLVNEFAFIPNAIYFRAKTNVVNSEHARLPYMKIRRWSTRGIYLPSKHDDSIFLSASSHALGPGEPSLEFVAGPLPDRLLRTSRRPATSMINASAPRITARVTIAPMTPPTAVEIPFPPF